jgi:outer membrane lipopolysaccharide assembly protein LptE/RlpB
MSKILLPLFALLAGLLLTACVPRPQSQLLAELPPFRLESAVIDPEFLWQIEQQLTAYGAKLTPQASAVLSLGSLEQRERRQLIAASPRLQEVEARYQLTARFSWDGEKAQQVQRLESYQRYLLEPERPLAANRSEAEQSRRALREMQGQILQFLASLATADVAKPERP